MYLLLEFLLECLYCAGGFPASYLNTLLLQQSKYYQSHDFVMQDITTMTSIRQDDVVTTLTALNVLK